MASVRERVEILKLIVDRNPEIGWKLLVNLLPEVTESISDNVRPSYRDWAAGWTGVITWREYRSFISELITLLLANVGDSSARWLELLEQINGLGAAQFADQVASIRDAIANRAAEGMPADLQNAIWEKLRQLVRDHTFFHDAHWALPPDEVKKFADLRDQIAPQDLIVTIKHLFDDSGMQEGDPTLTYEEREVRRESERRSAIRQLWNSGGMDSLMQLAGAVNDAWSVGLAAADELKGELQKHLIPDLLTSDNEPLRKMAAAYARKRIFDEGLEWAQRVPAPVWSEEQVMAFTLEMPFERRTWDWISNRGSWPTQHIGTKQRLWVASACRLQIHCMRLRGWKTLADRGPLLIC